MFGDAVSAIRQVMILDERVTRHQADIQAMKTDINSLQTRLSRLEGMFEMAIYRDTRRIDRD